MRMQDFIQLCDSIHNTGGEPLTINRFISFQILLSTSFRELKLSLRAQQKWMQVVEEHLLCLMAMLQENSKNW